MAIHGDRQLNWLGRLLGADTVQQSYQEYQSGPVLPTIDVIGTGPVQRLVQVKQNVAGAGVFDWTVLETGERFGLSGPALLPEGFYYRFAFIKVGATAGTWNLRIITPTSVAGFQETSTIIDGLGINNVQNTLWNETGAVGAVNESLRALAAHWIPGPVNLHVFPTAAGAIDIYGYALRIPLGAQCPP